MVLANFPPSSSPILDSHRINAWFERTNGRSVGRSVVRSVGYRAKNCCGSRGAHDFLSLFPKVNEGERSVEKRRAFLPRKCPRLRRIDEPFLSRGLLSFSLSRLSPCVESPRRSLTVSLSLSLSPTWPIYESTRLERRIGVSPVWLSRKSREGIDVE